jgi:hypothetical protein
MHEARQAFFLAQLAHAVRPFLRREPTHNLRNILPARASFRRSHYEIAFAFPQRNVRRRLLLDKRGLLGVEKNGPSIQIMVLNERLVAQVGRGVHV